ncbi:hypothetical protein NMG60_11030844 [Bertholletia excelsa]
MGDAGFVNFPGSLDPRAEEFRPRSPYGPTQITVVAPPAVYYPFPPPPPPPPPFAGAGVGVGYPQFGPDSTYNLRPLAPPLPPPCATATRTLLLSYVPAGVSESVLRRELELFGDVRAVEMGRLRNGVVTVHFYDIRHAQAALAAIREQHVLQQSRLRKHFDSLMLHNSIYDPQNSPLLSMPPPPATAARGLIAGYAVWAEFTIPAMAEIPDGHNQGTLVVFNLGSGVSTASLREIFEAFGPVKELRETPLKRHQRFVEFYDVRDAAKALSEMDGKEVHGRRVGVEFSRPGGHRRRFSRPTSNYPGRNNLRLPPPPPPPPPPSPPRFYTSGTQYLAKKPLNVGNNRSNVNIAVEERGTSIRHVKKGSKKGQCANQQQPNNAKSNRAFKGKHGKNSLDPRFLIDEDAIMDSNCRDSRTTVMIKNIPNKYSQKLLLNMLDNHCIHCNEQIGDEDDQPLSSYDFVYLPIDFINKCNVGYGFVNMTSPQATWRLYKAFHLQNWEVFNSKKICEVTYARLQGLEALKEHFKNSKFPCEAEEYLPVVFSPPRDGRRLTEPTPIVGRSHSPCCLRSPSAVSSKSSNIDYDNDDNDDEDQETGGGVETETCVNGGDEDQVSGGRGVIENGGDIDVGEREREI